MIHKFTSVFWIADFVLFFCHVVQVISVTSVSLFCLPTCVSSSCTLLLWLYVVLIMSQQTWEKREKSKFQLHCVVCMATMFPSVGKLPQESSSFLFGILGLSMPCAYRMPSHFFVFKLLRNLCPFFCLQERGKHKVGFYSFCSDGAKIPQYIVFVLLPVFAEQRFCAGEYRICLKEHLLKFHFQ